MRLQKNEIQNESFSKLLIYRQMKSFTFEVKLFDFVLNDID